MKNKFQKIHAFTSKWEGGFVDIKEDKGGATNWGISLVFLQHAYVQDKDFLNSIGIEKADYEAIKNLTKEQSEQLFYKFFYYQYEFELLPTHIAFLYYDMCVNHGIYYATKNMQKAFNNLKQGSQLTIDGLIGKNTMHALATIKRDEKFIELVTAERSAFYHRIVDKNETQRKFLVGWLNRTRDMQKTALALI